MTTITGKLSGSFSFDHLSNSQLGGGGTIAAHRTDASTLPVPPWIGESVDSVGEWLADIEAGLDLGNGISRSSLIVALKSAGRWPRQIPEAVYLLVFGCRLGAYQGTRSLHFDVPDPDAFKAAEELLARLVAQLIPMHELQWRALRQQARAWSMTTDKTREQIALLGVRHAARSRLNRHRRARFGAENQRVQLTELMWPNFPAFVYVVLNCARNFARESNGGSVQRWLWPRCAQDWDELFGGYGPRRATRRSPSQTDAVFIGPTWGRWSGGRRTSPSTNIEKIARALGLTAGQLLLEAERDR